MRITVDSVLKQFLERGIVATLRNYPYRSGQNIIINRKYRAKVSTVMLASTVAMNAFLHLSSFRSVDEWIRVAKEKHNGKFPKYLVIVTRRDAGEKAQME